LSERRNDPALWKEVENQAEWVTYRKPESVPLEGGLDSDPETLSKGLPKDGDLQSLKDALGSLNWKHDYLIPALISTHSPAGRADAIHLQWYRTPQGTGELDEEGEDWIVRLGESAPWKRVNFNSEMSEVLGVWSWGDDGRAALLLTSERGFFRTRDGGQSWEEANYNETGFTSGRAVRPIVVAGAETTFALIDRGSDADDGENPLFRLKHRSLLERWRTGLVRLLGGEVDGAGRR
jgi:hypothetical protein